MKKALMAAAALVALPVMAQAQSPAPGVYIGAEGGINWLLNFNANTNFPAMPVVGVTLITGGSAGLLGLALKFRSQLIPPSAPI